MPLIRIDDVRSVNNQQPASSQSVVSDQQSITSNQQVEPSRVEDSASVSVKAPEQTSQVTSSANSIQPEVQTSFKQILIEAIKLGASDFHLTPGYNAIVRVNGVLRSLPTGLLSKQFVINSIKEIFLSKGIKEWDSKKNEIDLSYSEFGRRFRVNIFKQQNTYSVVGRLVPEKIKTIDELGLPAIIKEFTKFPNGIVLVTGPTGSGKSTTLAAILNMINQTMPKHIITLEDPVEFVFPKGFGLVDQREFETDFNSWPHALRGVLRQDPDIVLIGEMRDKETIESALTVAETGHLVFATLHTNSASQTISRIIDVFPPENQDQIRTLLSTVLRAVVSQKLIQTKSGTRTIATEIMINNPAIASAIRDKKIFQIDNFIQTSTDVGMQSMEKSLTNLVKNSLVNLDVAKQSANKPDELDILLNK